MLKQPGRQNISRRTPGCCATCRSSRVPYEMIVGCGAFHRSTSASTIAAILNEQPRPVSGYSPDTPREFDRWINTAWKKTPIVGLRRLVTWRLFIAIY